MLVGTRHRRSASETCLYFIVRGLSGETTDPEWIRWINREFYTAIFAKGKKFNQHIKANNFEKLKQAFNGIINNFNDFVIVEELHVLPKIINNDGTVSYGNKVIMDNGFVEEVKNDFGVRQYYRIIYNDNKFGINSPWTPNQKSEIIHKFRDQPNLEYITLEVRSNDNFLTNSPVKNGGEIRLYREDIYKSLSNGVNDNPEFLEIINMKSIGFK